MDFLARLTGKRDDPASHPLLVQFEGVLDNIRDERLKLETLLSSVRGDQPDAIPGVLARLERRATELAGQLEVIGSRAEDLGRSTDTTGELQARIEALEAAVEKAEACAGQSVQRLDALTAERHAIDDLVSRATQATSTLQAALDDERLAQVAERLPVVADACDRFVERQDWLGGRLDELQLTANTVLQTASAAEELVGRVDEQSAGAAARLEMLQRKLDEALLSDRLAGDTSAQIQTLNALAEHVMTKVKAVETQQQTIDRALLDSRRVSEMVWETNVQIDRLREGSTLAASVEETLGRLEHLQQDVSARLEKATRDRGQFMETVEQQRQKSVHLLHVLQNQLDRLALNRSELDTLNERLTTAHSGVSEMERRLGELAQTEQTLSELGKRLDVFGAQMQGLEAQMGRLEQKQSFMDSLEGRLDELDDATRRATVQVDALARRRQELVTLKSEFDACEATYASVRSLADDLRERRAQFDRFAAETREFARGVPALEASLDTLKARVADIEAHAERTVAMRPRLEEVGERLELLGARFQMTEELQHRLDRLHELSATIDERLAAQLSRQGDLERAHVVCDGLATQLGDAQHKLDVIAAAQRQLAGVPDGIAALQADLTSAGQSLVALQLDRATIAAQEARLAELTTAAGDLLAEIGARLETLRTVGDDLSRASSLKEEVSGHVAEILAVGRDLAERHHEAELLLDQFGARWKQLDQRRAEFGTIQQSMDRLDERMTLLDRLAGTVDGKIAALAERDRIVDAVRQEIAMIHEVARQCQDNLAAIADQRAAVSEGRADVDRLTQALAAADGKLLEVERRSAAVEEVRRQAEAVGRLLEDVHVTLDTLGEQKATIDHVTEMLARVDAVMIEARGTTKALQAERKLAQRIVEKVRKIHARAGADVPQIHETQGA